MFLGPWIRFFGELFVVVSACFLGTVHGGAQIVPGKNRGSFPLSKDVVWCCLRMLLLAEYWGGAARTTSNNNSRISSQSLALAEAF